MKGQRAIEHVEELLPFFRDGRDTSGLQAMALAHDSVWLDPTMTIHESALQQAVDWAGVQARPGMRYLNPRTFEERGDSPWPTNCAPSCAPDSRPTRLCSAARAPRPVGRLQRQRPNRQ